MSKKVENFTKAQVEEESEPKKNFLKNWKKSLRNYCRRLTNPLFKIKRNV